MFVSNQGGIYGQKHRAAVNHISLLELLWLGFGFAIFQLHVWFSIT